MLGQSGSHRRHRHSTAFSSRPPKSPSACPQPPHQVMGRQHKSQRALAAHPQILCLTQNCLHGCWRWRKMEITGCILRPRSSWLHGAVSARLWHSHTYPATSTPPPWDSQGSPAVRLTIKFDGLGCLFLFFEALSWPAAWTGVLPEDARLRTPAHMWSAGS